MPKLIKTVVDSLVKKNQGKDLTVFDGGIPGYGFHIRKTGHATYILQYRSGGRIRKLTLGIHGRITPDKARKLATAAVAAINRGEDPATERDQGRKAETLAEFVKRYLTDYLEPKRKASTAKEFRRTIERDILPRLGTRKVISITGADVDHLHRAMKSSPIQANRTLTVLSSILGVAEKWGIRPRGTNPCRHVERFRESKRERFLLPAELARLGEVLADVENEERRIVESGKKGRRLLTAITAIRLLTLTGMRRGEVLNLRWEDVDFARGVLVLPDSKTGRKMVPLPAPALEVLEKAPRKAGNPWVCWGAGSTSRLVGLQKVWEMVRKRAELGDARLHDLRHSFASVGAAAGVALFVIGKVLGHSQASTTQRYAHLAENPIRAAAERISAEIAALLNGHTGAAVVPFRGGKG